MLSRRSHRMRRARIVGGLTACHRATWKRWGAEGGDWRSEGGMRRQVYDPVVLWTCGLWSCGTITVRTCVCPLVCLRVASCRTCVSVQLYVRRVCVLWRAVSETCRHTCHLGQPNLQV